MSLKDEQVEEEIKRISMHDELAGSQITSQTLRQPIEKLFSKRAVCVDVGETVGEALELMRKHEYGAVVVTRDGKVAGIITERDLICKTVGVVDDFLALPVTEAMTPDPITLQNRDPIVYVMHNMQIGGYRHVPIVDEEDRPVSVVSIKDVVRFVLSYFPQDVYNLTPEPYRGERRRESG